jgi:hypothetical protein
MRRSRPALIDQDDVVVFAQFRETGQEPCIPRGWHHASASEKYDRVLRNTVQLRRQHHNVEVDHSTTTRRPILEHRSLSAVRHVAHSRHGARLQLAVKPAPRVRALSASA